jgi:glyoxylase-like metal-dependent hydrolase (beta-lactamase superfamily II)
LLTHGHYDHIGAAKELSLLENCKIYASLFDKELFENGDKNGSIRFGKKEIIVDNITYFDEEVILELGDFMVEVMFLPGHTPGGVAYIIGEAVFTGDTLFKGTYGRVDLYGGNKKDMKKSLEYLLTLDGSMKVFPGHGDVTTIEEERNNFRL